VSATIESPYVRRSLDAYLDDVLQQLPGILLVGPRAAGKTTTLARRAATVVRLAAGSEAAAFRADADAALRGLPEPVLLDEWQEAPDVFAAAARAINAAPSPSRYFLTGSVRAHLRDRVFGGTGRVVTLTMYPMTVRERLGLAGASTFFDKVERGESFDVPADTPDLRGYIELALQSGFPVAGLVLSGAARDAALEAYVDDLITHDVEQVEALENRRRGFDRLRLRRYFEAFAVNTAGVVDDKTLYDAAGVNRETAIGYEQLLADLFAVESVPAWSSNRLSRVVDRPKRYVIEPALVAAALRVDVNGVLLDGDLLGRLLDTFVAAQLRPEVGVSAAKPRLFHLRTKGGRQEVDLLAELRGDRVIGIEIKAGAAPQADDARHLAWLRDRLGDRFVQGVVFHPVPRQYALADRIVALPISALWGGAPGTAR
jgi:predicted AAA+ superfamily ATPase